MSVFRSELNRTSPEAALGKPRSSAARFCRIFSFTGLRKDDNLTDNSKVTTVIGQKMPLRGIDDEGRVFDVAF